MTEVAEQIQAATNEIAEYCPIEAGLAELRRKYANVAVDVSTTKALDEAKRVRAEIREPRYETEKIRKMLKAPALAHAKLIDTEAARITTELLAIETPWDEAIKAEEKRKEAEKEAREAAERARITTIHERIAAIKGFAALAIECRTSARIKELIDKLANTDHGDFAEFSEEASTAITVTGEAMQRTMDTKLADESERAAIKATQDAAAAKLAAERAEFEAQQVAAKAEADRLKAIAAAQAAQDKARLEAEQAAMALQRAQFEQEQAQMRETLATQARKLAADMAEIEAKKVPPAPVEQAQIAIEAIAPADLPITMAEPACCAPDGVCTDACSSNASAEPSDADVIWEAVRAVSDAFEITSAQAIERLAAIQDWIIQP